MNILVEPNPGVQKASAVLNRPITVVKQYRDYPDIVPACTDVYTTANVRTPTSIVANIEF